MTTASSKIFGDLQESFRDGRLIPFVGAGFTMVDPNGPSWKGLLDILRAELSNGQKKVFDDLSDFLEQAEYYDNSKPGKITAKVRAVLEGHPKIPGSLEPHKLMLLNFDRIYTTNYDNYFEDVAASLSPTITIHNVPAVDNGIPPPVLHPYIKRNKSSNRIACLKKLEKAGALDKACRLVKYHGDYHNKKSLVFTETSYFERLLDADAKDILFAGDALFYDFLFLGYGFGDVSLKYTLQQLDRTFETLGNTTTGTPGRRNTDFFILRTDKRPRNRYQDKAYGLRSVNMADFLPQFSKDDCVLRHFYTKRPAPRVVEEGKRGTFEFSSFSSLWDSAETKSDDSYCNCSCTKSDCSKVHLAGTLLGRKDEVTNAAKQFRAHVLNESFTEFLKRLGCK